MAFTKKTTKSPAVMVETKKLSAKDTCCTSEGCKKFKKLVMFGLLFLNTILIIWVLCNKTKIESDRVGGRANYEMVEKIYKSPAFKAQQKQQIQQALQMYQGGGAQAAQQPVNGTQQLPTPTVK